MPLAVGPRVEEDEGALEGPEDLLGDIRVRPVLALKEGLDQRWRPSHAGLGDDAAGDVEGGVSGRGRQSRHALAQLPGRLRLGYETGQLGQDVEQLLGPAHEVALTAPAMASAAPIMLTSAKETIRLG